MHEVGLQRQPALSRTHPDLPSGLAGEALALARQLRLIEDCEEVGQASRALRLMEQELAVELRGDSADRLSLVAELHRVYVAYCQLLYAGLLPSLSTFSEWVGWSLSEQVLVVVRQWAASPSSLPLVRVHSDLLQPIYAQRSEEKTDLLLSFLSTKGYRVPQVHRAEEDWEQALVCALAEVLREGNLAVLEETASLAEASVPTLPKEKRRLRDVGQLVRLVTEACLGFDDLNRGLAAMWRLVVTTPESVTPGMEEDFAMLDIIQAALAAGDILRAYLPLPPLSVMTRDPRRDRLLERGLAKETARGLGYLDVDLDELERLGLSFVRDPPPLETRVVDLWEAMLLRMCSSLADRANDGLGDVEQLVNDVAELRCGLLAGLRAEWVGAVLLNAVLHHCPMEVTFEVVDICLRRFEADGEGTERPLPALQSLGVSVSLVEHLVINRAAGVFDSAASCYDSGSQRRYIVMLFTQQFLSA